MKKDNTISKDEQSLEDKHSHKSHSHHSHNLNELSSIKIFWVVMLNATITIVEIIGGIISGSLALISDSIHNLSDTAAIFLSYIANKISKKESNDSKTFGYKRAEILSAFINSVVLFTISLFLVYEAFKRFNNPETINGTIMIVVGGIGLLANFISVYLLEKNSHDSLNIKSSYLHLISDTVSSVGVVLGGIAITFLGIVWIDPVITLLISIYIIIETFKVILKTISIMMESSPILDYDQIKKDIEAINQVVNVHHIHAWMMNENTIYFEAHIDVKDNLLSEVNKTTKDIEMLLKNTYGVYHVTLQAEVNCCNDKDLFSKD